MNDLTKKNFRVDEFYPRVQSAVDSLLCRGQPVALVEVLVKMKLLTNKQLETWRRGEVQYLEQVIGCSASEIKRILRILEFYAVARGLQPKSRKRKSGQRFTKSGNSQEEGRYRRAFRRKKETKASPPRKKKSKSASKPAKNEFPCRIQDSNLYGRGLPDEPGTRWLGSRDPVPREGQTG